MVIFKFNLVTLVRTLNKCIFLLIILRSLNAAVMSSVRVVRSTNTINNKQKTTLARERKKASRKICYNRRCKSIYDERGHIVATGLDLCDCLDETCPGCHFPCEQCNSCKCGHECRVYRKWMYDRIEIEGNDFVIRNVYKKN